MSKRIQRTCLEKEISEQPAVVQRLLDIERAVREAALIRIQLAV